MLQRLNGVSEGGSMSRNTSSVRGTIAQQRPSSTWLPLRQLWYSIREVDVVMLFSIVLASVNNMDGKPHLISHL